MFGLCECVLVLLVLYLILSHEYSCIEMWIMYLLSGYLFSYLRRGYSYLCYWYWYLVRYMSEFSIQQTSFLLGLHLAAECANHGCRILQAVPC